MPRFPLRHALFTGGLLLIGTLLVLVTPALAGHAPDPTDTTRPIPAPQAHPTAAVPPAIVYFTLDPAKDRYAVGDVFTATLEIDNLTDFMGGDFTMSFDPHSFQVLDTDPVRPKIQVMPGNLLPRDASFIVPAPDGQADNTTGQIHFAGTRTVGGAANGSGSLVLIPFQVTRGCGEMTLSVPPVTLVLANTTGESLPIIPGPSGEVILTARQCSFVYLPHLSVAQD